METILIKLFLISTVFVGVLPVGSNFEKLTFNDFHQENPKYQLSEFIMHPILVFDFFKR